MPNNPMRPTYDQLINGDDAYVKRIERAYCDKHGHPPNITDQAHNIWRLLVEGWSIEDVLRDIAGEVFVPAPAPVPEPEPAPEPQLPSAPVDLTSWPRRGASIAAVIVDPHWDIRTWARILGERFRGRGLTRVNVLSNDWGGPQLWPFLRVPDGRFDLDRYNPAFLARAQEVVGELLSQGIVVQLTLLELYSWSHRKSSAPNQDRTPFNFNVNGVRWLSRNTEEDDRTLTALPDAKLTQFLDWFVPQVDQAGVVWEIGNEFPEKPLHERMAAVLRHLRPSIQLSVNRNEDAPGQYFNMGIDRGSYARIAFHGNRLKAQAHLDAVYPHETPTGRPDTFRKLLQDSRVDKARVIFSSDGARSSSDPIDTYDWPTLEAFAREVLRLGCSYEHQSRLKMDGNSYNFDRTEYGFLDALARV